MPVVSPPRRVLFVTGRLAEPALRRMLAEMAPPFTYDVAVLGITDKDFDLARRIEDLALWRPAEGGALQGTPNKFVRSGDPRG